jgi:hypothetical protein
LDAVKAEALHSPSAFHLLEELTDRIGPRLTGSPADARAGQWALDTMRAIGLQNVHAESWQLERGWRRGSARCRLLSPFELDLIVTSYGWSGSTPKRDMEAAIIAVDSDRPQKNWAGSVLLAAPGVSHTTAQLSAFLKAAESAGAAAVILPGGRPGAGLPHTNPLGFLFVRSSLAVLDIAVEHAALLTRLLHTNTPVRVTIDVRNEFTAGPVESRNLSGEIPGARHPEEVVLLGAHLDSWDLATGAIDDGFGVAAVLGAAKSIVASRIKPDRTIRFVLFTGEEQGLLGSRAYVRAHAAELPNLICALVLDWGQGSITKFPLAGHTELSPAFDELFAAIADVAPLRTASGFLTYTDAYSFTFAGVPAVAPLQDSANYSMWGHSAADTLDKVSPDVLSRDSAVLALAAVWIANYPSRIGTFWTPERTAKELADQRDSLKALGLWPF